MSNNPNNIILAIIFILALVAFDKLLRRSNSISNDFSNLIIIGASFYLTYRIAISKLQGNQSEALLIAVIAAVIANELFSKKRTRHIPASERRKAIARFERETGEKYNPKKHEIDHIAPFSRGGNNIANNLRVIPKKENRKRGNRNRWWE